MGYLVACGAALAWAVANKGAVLPADRFTSALAFAVIALVLFLLARRSSLAPRLSPWIRWPALLLPVYAALQCVPLPLAVPRVLSPARGDGRPRAWDKPLPCTVQQLKPPAATVAN